MWVAEMDFPVAPAIGERLAGLFERNDFGYPPEPPPAEASELREAVAGWMLRRHGWAVDSEMVSITPDTMRVLEIAIALFSEPGDPVVLANPVYQPFRVVIEDAGRAPLWVPMVLSGSRWELDLDLLGAAFARDDVRVYLHCNPHNPTGTVHTLEELQAMAALADKHDVIVVSDEVHGDLTYGVRHVPFVTAAPGIASRTITASAATKAFNFAGLRCGFAIAGSPEIHRQIRGVPVRQRKLTSLPGYEATIAAYTAGDAWIDALVEHLRDMRDRAIDRLASMAPSLLTTVPEGTYLLWTDWRNTGVDDPQAFLLERAKVALSPGEVFGSAGDGFLRLNFATSRTILDEGLDRIEATLGDV